MSPGFLHCLCSDRLAVTAMSESERINFALEHVGAIYPGMRDHFEAGVTKC
jgi:hypothetical protein